MSTETGTDEVAANLEAALVGESEESSTSKTESKTATETVVETATDKTAGKDENRIPQSRLNEVIETRNAAQTALSERDLELAESNKALATMTELLESKTADSETLEAIKGYIHDPELKEHVEAIDRALRGVEVEVEQGDITPEQAADKNKVLIDQIRSETQDALADQAAEALIGRADIAADKLLGELPKEYTDQDRSIIGDLWADKVDWESAAQNPDNLQEILHTSFQEVIDRFGAPRGGVIQGTEDSETETVALAPTPEQELATLMEKDYGAVTEGKSASGKATFNPDVSDADFTKAMADAMRIARSS